MFFYIGHTSTLIVFKIQIQILLIQNIYCVDIYILLQQNILIATKDDILIDYHAKLLSIMIDILYIVLCYLWYMF